MLYVCAPLQDFGVSLSIFGQPPSIVAVYKITIMSKVLFCLRLSAFMLLLTSITIGELTAKEAPAVDSPKARQTLIQQLATETGLPADEIRPLIMKARYDASIITRIKTPYEGRPYNDYRKLFVNKKLLTKARSYLQKHAKAFDVCEQRYGVQREIIAAILGMETRFGSYLGKDRVLDSLLTLSLGFPRRAKFFRHQLGELLLLSREEQLDPVKFMGSYAGAFGVTQFIPSSYRSFAVDADEDGRRDVWNTPLDIICSVGHYFQRHHWDASRPLMQWQPNLAALQKLRVTKLKQWRHFADIRASVVDASPRWKNDDRIHLIAGRDGVEGHELALVHYNFYVITRWNRSYHYAMAASEVAEALHIPFVAKNKQGE